MGSQGITYSWIQCGAERSNIKVTVTKNRGIIVLDLSEIFLPHESHIIPGITSSMREIVGFNGILPFLSQLFSLEEKHLGIPDNPGGIKPHKSHNIRNPTILSHLGGAIPLRFPDVFPLGQWITFGKEKWYSILIFSKVHMDLTQFTSPPTFNLDNVEQLCINVTVPW